jgi:hypothetical protein
MMFKKLLFLCLFYVAVLPVQGQWLVWFADKGLQKPNDAVHYLSQKSLQRRCLQHIPLNESDLPVYSPYLNALKPYAKVRQVSKWLNAAYVDADENSIAALQKMPFIIKMERASGIKAKPCAEMQTQATPFDTITNTANQLEMLGLNYLHANRYTGKGIIITFVDGGFTAVDEALPYRHIFDNNRLIAARNFVTTGRDIYKMGGEGEHGCRVFSIAAGLVPNKFYGAAYDASFILAVTEDAFNESSLEEMNWAAAAEWADSIGTHIINSSVGYFTGFTSGKGYTYADMDGKTTIVTKAAQAAASKGILVVSSVGNEGSKDWRYLIAPSDGDSVLAAGGVDALGMFSEFSSRGPSADGRIKPDLCARADQTIQIGADGRIIWGWGTSFSAPLLSGLAACLWQADTGLTNMQLMRLMKESASRYINPDYNYGFGIPSATQAFKAITGKELLQTTLKPGDIKIMPNPVRGGKITLGIDEGVEVLPNLLLILYDNRGRKITEEQIALQPRLWLYEVNLQRYFHMQGIYYLHIQNPANGKLLLKQKILISESF